MPSNDENGLVRTLLGVEKVVAAPQMTLSLDQLLACCCDPTCTKQLCRRQSLLFLAHLLLLHDVGLIVSLACRQGRLAFMQQEGCMHQADLSQRFALTLTFLVNELMKTAHWACMQASSCLVPRRQNELKNGKSLSERQIRHAACLACSVVISRFAIKQAAC